MKFTWGIFPVREVKTASSWVSLLNAKRSSWNKGKKRWQQLPLLWLQFFFQLWGDSLNEAPNAFSKRNVCFDFFLTFGHQILTSETSNSNGRPIKDEWHSVSRNRADTALWNIFPRNWTVCIQSFILRNYFYSVCNCRRSSIFQTSQKVSFWYLSTEIVVIGWDISSQEKRAFKKMRLKLFAVRWSKLS